MYRGQPTLFCEYHRSIYNGSAEDWGREIVGSLDCIVRSSNPATPVPVDVVAVFNDWKDREHAALIAEIRADRERYGHSGDDHPAPPPPPVQRAAWVTGTGWVRIRRGGTGPDLIAWNSAVPGARVPSPARARAAVSIRSLVTGPAGQHARRPPGTSGSRPIPPQNPHGHHRAPSAADGSRRPRLRLRTAWAIPTTSMWVVPVVAAVRRPRPGGNVR